MLFEVSANFLSVILPFAISGPAAAEPGEQGRAVAAARPIHGPAIARQSDTGSEVKPGKPNHSATAPEACLATTQFKPLLKAQAGA